MPVDKKINYLELPAQNLSAIQALNLLDSSSSTSNGAALIVIYANNLEQMKKTIESHI